MNGNSFQCSVFSGQSGCAVCGGPPHYVTDIGGLCPECFADSKQIERTLMMKVGLRPMTALEFARYVERRAA